MSVTSESAPEINAVLAGQSPAPVDRATSIVGGQLLEYLSSGGRVGLITGPDRCVTTTLLNEVADAFAGPVFKAANPLLTPLSLARLLLQVDALGDHEDDAASLGAYLTRHASPGQPTLLAVDDAHSLDDEAFAAIAAMAAWPEVGQHVLVLLAGRLDLVTHAASMGFDPDPAQVLIVTLNAPSAASSSFSPGPDEEPRAPPASAPPAVPSPPLPLTAPLLASASTPEPILFRDPVLPSAYPSVRLGLDQFGPSSVRKAFVDPVASSPVLVSNHGKRSAVLAVMVIAAACALAGTVVLRRGEAVNSGTTPDAATVVLSPNKPRIPPVPEPQTAPAAPPEAKSVPLDAVPQATLPSAPNPAEPVVPRSMSSSKDQLRREFQAFLTRTGRSLLAQDTSKFEALFQDYLRWKFRNQSGGVIPVPR